MANITRFDPFGDLASFRRMGDLDSLFKGLRLQPCAGDLEGEPRIKVDVEEDERNYTVKADIPGVNKDDIHVSVEGSQVSIEAEVKKETEEKKGKNVVRSERYVGKSYRSFSLAQQIDSGKVVAKYDNGVLQLTLTKKGNGAAKQIKVQ